MSKRVMAGLFALLCLAVFTACNTGGEATVTSLPSLADTRGASQPGGAGGESEEPAFVDDGEAAANVADEEVVSDFAFTMEYPGDWSYLSMEELGLDGKFIFAAGNRVSSSSIIVQQPLDAEGQTLDGYTDTAMAGMEEMVALYETMGISGTLSGGEKTQLGGRNAWSTQFAGESSEVEFTLTLYVVETPTGDIITVTVTTYSDEDASVAKTALASISWG